jgi:hypothetical protein
MQMSAEPYNYVYVDIQGIGEVLISKHAIADVMILVFVIC